MVFHISRKGDAICPILGDEYRGLKPKKLLSYCSLSIPARPPHLFLSPLASTGPVGCPWRLLISTTDGPHLRWFNLWLFTFMMVQKWYRFSKTNLQIEKFEFPWASGVWWDTVVMLGSRSDHEGKQPVHSPPLCADTTISFFSFNTVFYKLH